MQQVSAGSAAFLSMAKAGRQCRGKVCCAPRSNAIFWAPDGVEAETPLDSMTDGKKKYSQRSSFSLPDTGLLNERTVELDAVASPDMEAKIRK